MCSLSYSLEDDASWISYGFMRMINLFSLQRRLSPSDSSHLVTIGTSPSTLSRNSFGGYVWSAELRHARSLLLASHSPFLLDLWL